MEEMYCVIGEIIEICQFIEHNFAIMMCREDRTCDADELFLKMSKMTLGQVVGLVKKSGMFNEDAISDFEKMVNDRNEIVHQFFKKNDFQNNQKPNFFKNRLSYLKNRLKELHETNSWLCEIIGSY